MSSKDLLTEYKLTIAELTQEKKDAVELVAIKDSKIKKILIQLEQANSDVQALGSKIAELQEKLSKKETIKRIINKKIDEILEKKDEETVDKDD
jgi:chromosome segregation ATPase